MKKILISLLAILILTSCATNNLAKKAKDEVKIEKFTIILVNAKSPALSVKAKGLGSGFWYSFWHGSTYESKVYPGQKKVIHGVYPGVYELNITKKISKRTLSHFRQGVLECYRRLDKEKEFSTEIVKVSENYQVIIISE